MTAPDFGHKPARLGRRFTEHFEAAPERVRGLAPGHRAIQQGRTLFPSRVVSAAQSGPVLVSGINQRKIGGKVTKGAWAGMPIYTLTLEERATCPRTCHNFDRCYGNSMPHPERHDADDALIEALRIETAYLARRHRGGYVVRLHILGDFYSVAYVAMWGVLLANHPELHVFGYTAWPRDTLIGASVQRLNDAVPDRCAIRFSAPARTGLGMDAVTIWQQPERKVVAEGIICPAQNGGADACGACGLCWAEPARDKTIVFIGHGPKWQGRPPKSEPRLRVVGDAPRRRGRQPVPLDDYRRQNGALISTYRAGSSLAETAAIHEVPIWKVVYILKRAEIERRPAGRRAA